MALPYATRTRYLAEKTRIETRLTALEAIEDEFSGTRGYELDTGEGRQRENFRSMDEVRKERESLENRYEWLCRKLECTGLVNLRSVWPA